MTVHVLILCTHNAARSQLAEATLRHWARQLGADLVAHSAGSAASGQVHPLALQALQRGGIDTAGLHSKSWDRFAEPGQPALDLVITVCDSAAGEACPLWPGTPLRVHWGYADPSRAPEAERAEAFERTRDAIGARMRALAQAVKDGWPAGDATARRAALDALAGRAA